MCAQPYRAQLGGLYDPLVESAADASTQGLFSFMLGLRNTTQSQRHIMRQRQKQLQLVRNDVEKRNGAAAAAEWEEELHDKINDGNARIDNVGKYQSCMVSKLRIVWKQKRSARCGSCATWPPPRHSRGRCAQQYVGKSQSCMVISGHGWVRSKICSAS